MNTKILKAYVEYSKMMQEVPSWYGLKKFSRIINIG